MIEEESNLINKELVDRIEAIYNKVKHKEGNEYLVKYNILLVLASFEIDKLKLNGKTKN